MVLPSGLDSGSGELSEVVLPATTMTFGGVKAAFTRGGGPTLADRVVLVRLGPQLTDAVGEASVGEIREG